MAKGKGKKRNKSRKSGANKQTPQPATPPQNQQDSSLFFQKLPLDIRLAIYSDVFCATRLSFGERSTGMIGAVRLRPAPNSLSLLRVCRRAKDDIGHSWLGQVPCNFEDAETMLDKLSALAPSMLAKLRHMRVSGQPLLLSIRGEEQDRRYGWARIFKLLPGLCLDRLTVLGSFHTEPSYDHLDDLIRTGDGWKELYYLSHNSEIIGFPALYKDFEWQDDFQRAPQPSTWKSALVSRDGQRADVKVYRSTHAGHHGSMISRPTTRQLFSGQTSNPNEEYGVMADLSLMTSGEKEKELLVVARRGDGIDYAQRRGTPLVPDDIRSLWPGATWTQIRHEGIDWLGEGNSDDDIESCFGENAGRDVDEHGCLIKVDTYKQVDDYEWTPLHLKARESWY